MKTYIVNVRLRNGETIGAIWTSRTVSNAAEALQLTLDHLSDEQKGTEKKISIEVKS